MRVAPRPLRQLYQDGGNKRVFALDYVSPPRQHPHHSNWSRAGKHWLQFNETALQCDSIPVDASREDAVELAEKIAMRVLWYLLEADRFCPRCPSRRLPIEQVSDYLRFFDEPPKRGKVT